MEVHTAKCATIDSLIQLVKQMHKGRMTMDLTQRPPPPAGSETFAEDGPGDPDQQKPPSFTPRL